MLRVYTWSNSNDGMGIGQADGGLRSFNDPHFNPFKGEIGIFRFYESALLPGQVLENYDAVTGSLSVTSFDATSASGATVNVNPNGSFTYDPGSLFDYLKDGESVVDTFTYTAEDDMGGSDTATVSITVNGINDAPTAITPSFNINEKVDTSSGTSLGKLIATDEDAGETFTYSILGGTDQLKFSIGGVQNDELILTDGLLDFETQPSYDVTVRVTDSFGNTYDEAITVSVNDLNESPTAITPTSFNINENVDTSSGTSVGVLITTDEDAGETFTYSILGGTDQLKFSIGGALSDELILTDGTLDFETKSSYAVTVRVTDSGGLTYDEAITVSVNDVNESPTAITPTSFRINEGVDTSSGTSVGTLLAADEDAGETFTYSIQGGADQPKFSIGGALNDELILTDGTVDYDTQSSYDVTVRVTDSFGNTYDEIIVVNVIDRNQIWFSTKGNGGAGGETWSDSDAVQFGDPGMTLEPTTGTTAGTLGLTGFSAPADIRGMHMVRTNIIVGGMSLAPGDLLFTIDANGLPGDEYDFGSFVADRHDIVRFRPDSPGNYSSGTYEMFLDEAVHDNGGTFFNVHAFSLIEEQVTVGSTVLNVGDIVVAHSSPSVHDNIYKFSVTSTGYTTTVTSDEVLLLRGSGGPSDTGFDGVQIQGLSVLDRDLNIGDTFLNAGTILVSLNTNSTEAVSDNNLTVQGEDIFYLTVSQSEPIGTITNATLLVEGADLGLDSDDENINGLTLVGNILSPNSSPTDITPDSFNINENTDTSGGTSVGTLTATDPDSGDTFTYSIQGGADQLKFSIGGALNDELILTDGTLDYETQSSYAVTVRVTDSFGNTYDEAITVDVNDLNEAPTAITPTNFNLNENTDTSSGTSVGTLLAADEDAGETFTYSIQGGADQLKFSIGGALNDELILTDGTLDFETQSSYAVTVRVTDSFGNTYDEAITVDVNDLNESPTAITPTSFNINENIDTSAGTSVGTLITTDEDAGETFTYSILGGTDQSKFSIGGALNDELILTDGTLDFETQSSYAVTVRVTDSFGNTYDEAITVNVNDLNEAPTAIAPTRFNINENTDTSSGTSVGTLLATDEDAGETFTYSIQGGADQLKFSIGGALNDELILTDGTLDYDTQSRYEVTVRVTDSFGNSYDEMIVVKVIDRSQIWFSTNGNGEAGGRTWNDSNAVQFGEPGMTLEPTTGTTAGTLGLTGFSAPADIRGMHMVRSNITVGGMSLNPGDLLFTFDTNGFPGNEYDFGSFVADRHDIVRFRPDAPGNYTSGTYEMFLDEAVHDGGGFFFDVNAFSLIEEQVTVGSTLLNAGDIVVAHSGLFEQDNIYAFSVSNAGYTTTVTSDEVLLLRGSGGSSNTGFDNFRVKGLSVLDRDLNLGDTFLSAGSVLVSIDAFGTNFVGDNNLAVRPEDIFYLNVSQSEPFATTTTATLLVDGSDLGLTEASSEYVNGFTLVADILNPNSSPTDITPDSFFVDENTDTTGGTSVGTLTTTDPDSGDTFSYAIVGGADQFRFGIGGALNDELVLTDGFLDFESKPSYAVTVRVTDGFGNTYDEAIAVNVNDLNEAPTAITPISFSINDNVDTSSGTSVGALVTADEDNGETFTYTIIGGAGSNEVQYWRSA